MGQITSYLNLTKSAFICTFNPSSSTLASTNIYYGYRDIYNNYVLITIEKLEFIYNDKKSKLYETPAEYTAGKICERSP